MSRKLRFRSFLLASSMLTSVLAATGSASAAPAAGTAVVDVHEVLAGRQQQFLFTVDNPSLLGSAVNFVQIGPEFLDEGFTVVSGGADGWVFDVSRSGRARFTGGSIPAGDGASFTVLADPDRPAEDLPVDWQVEVADDGTGEEVTNLSPAGDGALTTQIRVLQVTAVNFVAPTGAADHSVTSGQPNVEVETVVANVGSAPLTVSPSLGNLRQEIVGTPTPAAATIQSGATETFRFPVTIRHSGLGKLTGGATAPGASAVTTRSALYSIEDPAEFAYTEETLLPTAAASGSSRSFALSLDKTNLPAVDLSTATTLVFSDGSHTFSAPLAAPTNVGRGPGSVTLDFAAITVPGSAVTRDLDGSYTPTLQLEGTDDNGAPVSRLVSVADSFTIDNLMPVVLPTISAPAGQTSAGGQSVVKDGDTVTFGGTIKEGAGDLDPVDPAATITSCDLVVSEVTDTGGIGAPIRTIPVPLDNCGNDEGAITGSFTLDDLGTEEGLVRLEIVARDTSGNSSAPASSNLLGIDNVAPTFTAVTGCGGSASGLPTGACDNLKTVRMRLSEPVKGDFRKVDFEVAGNVVLNASSTCTTTTFCNQIVLTLAQAMGEDARPSVGYRFLAAPLRQRASDGSAHQLTNAAVQAADGIVPDLPTVASVSQHALAADGSTVDQGFGLQDGSFFTNDVTPTFSITGLSQGYQGIVALDTNGSGDYEEGFDEIIASCLSDAASVDCEAVSLAADGRYNILVASIDSQGNLSQGRAGTTAGKRGRPATLDLDRVAPVGTTFTSGASTVVVTFDDSIARGRDAAVDWFPFVMEGTRKRVVKDTSVTGTGASRTINLDSTETGIGLSGISYLLEGTPDQRYRDRAGNYLADFTL